MRIFKWTDAWIPGETGGKREGTSRPLPTMTLAERTGQAKLKAESRNCPATMAPRGMRLLGTPVLLVVVLLFLCGACLHLYLTRDLTGSLTTQTTRMRRKNHHNASRQQRWEDEEDASPRTSVLHEIDTLNHTTLPENIDGYLHFTNVALRKNGSKSILDVFQPSNETRRALNSYSLPKYYRWSYKDDTQFYDLLSPEIVIHNRPMHPSRDCPSNWRRDEIAYFYSPWVTKNFWHLHNDNILCMVDNIRHTPECNSTTLECGGGADQHHLRKALYLFEGTETPEQEVKAASELRNMLYDSTRPLSAMWGEHSSVCFAGLSWGRGNRFYYKDGEEIVKNVRDAVTALNEKVRSHYNLGPREENGRKVKATYINRQGSPSRNIEDPSPIMEACETMGWECTECCDWKKESFKDMLAQFRDTQVVFGPHGAGLAHVLYARPNATLVDFGEPDGWFKQFGRMVASVGSGDRIVVPDIHGTFSWSRDDALKYFQQVRTTNVTNTTEAAEQ